MGKLRIHGCTHCQNGEVYIDHDQYGWYECCLQCGYSRDLPDITQPAGQRSWSAEDEAEMERKRRLVPVGKRASKRSGRM